MNLIHHNFWFIVFLGGVLFECCYHLCGEIQFNLDVVTIVYKHVNRGLGETQYCTHARRHVDWSISTIKPLGHSCCWLTIPFRMWSNAAKWKNRNLVLLQKFRFLAGLTFNSIAAHQKIWKDFFFIRSPPKLIIPQGQPNLNLNFRSEWWGSRDGTLHRRYFLDFSRLFLR